MATGINENISILGREFHIQTEVSLGEDPKIRTTVYDGGRIVASRDVPADPDRQSEDEILEQIRAQHGLIIDNLITRSAALAKRKGGAPPSSGSRDAASVAAKDRATRTRHPLPAGSDPSLRRALRTRRLVGPFSQRFSAYGVPPTSCDTDLEAAGTSIDSIMGSPACRGLRLDEQIRFFDLKERIDLWRTGGDPDVDPAALLDDITAFARHLHAINDRRELADFDHRLLLWAIGAIGSAGITDDSLGHLQSLRGRDLALDHLLDGPGDIDQDHVLELLIGLLDRTLPPGGRR